MADKNQTAPRSDIIAALACEIALETDAEHSDHKKRLLDDHRVRRVENLLSEFATSILISAGVKVS